MNEKTIYKLIASSCETKVMKNIAKILEKYKDNFTGKKKYVIHFSFYTSKVCGLLEINKFKLIQDTIKEQRKEFVHIIEQLELKQQSTGAASNFPAIK